MAEVVNEAVDDANKQPDADEPVEDEEQVCPVELILTIQREREWAKDPDATNINAQQGGTIGKFDLKKSGVEAPLVDGYTLEAAGPSSRTADTDHRIPAGMYSMIKNPGRTGPYRLVQTTEGLAEMTFGERYWVNIHSGNLPEHIEGCILPAVSWEEVTVGDTEEVYPKVTSSKNKLDKLKEQISAHAKTEKQTTYDGKETYTNKTFYTNVMVVIKEIVQQEQQEE